MKTPFPMSDPHSTMSQLRSLIDHVGRLDLLKSYSDKFLEVIRDQLKGYNGHIPHAIDNEYRPSNSIK